MTYVFDIDGTICTLTDGNYLDAKPILERIEKVNSLYDQGDTIIFLTARGMGRHKNDREKATSQFYDMTFKQLKLWNVKFHELYLGKPAGDVYVDDKGQKDTQFFAN